MIWDASLVVAGVVWALVGLVHSQDELADWSSWRIGRLVVFLSSLALVFSVAGVHFFTAWCGTSAVGLWWVEVKKGHQS